ncbi:UDP-glucose 4-epimerase GalE [Chloroflexota bacterium]
MTILVTGGAGYVGSIVAEELLNKGYDVVVLDDLRQGHKEAISPGVQFSLTDICDETALDKVFHLFEVSAVIHMAAETAVEYSMTDPRRYFKANVLGGMKLLEAMLRNNCLNIVFSSTAAVYGEPRSLPIEEDHPETPTNAYGESKLIFEHILGWYGQAYGLKHISLRYFNAAGATELLGEDHRPETHLIPNILKVAIDKNKPVAVFGTNYQTRDGSCIRDYIHVADIARAHLLSLQKLNDLNSRIYNLGNGNGYSVFEVIETARKITGLDITVEHCARRSGDPAELVASSNRARDELGWVPCFPELESIIKSSWRWMLKHPNGYGSNQLQ